MTCWLVFTLHFATNTVREIYPALSLADHLSFDVSEYGGLHQDIFEIPGRGTFINNNPGASIIGAIPYAILRPLTDRIVERVRVKRASEPVSAAAAHYDSIYPLAQEFYQKARERGLDVKFGLAAGIMQAFAMAPISALGVVAMFWVIFALTDDRRASVWLAMLYAFATPIFFRTAQLNQNVLVANFAFFAFVLLWRPMNNRSGNARPFYFLAGLCAGWTVVLDYSGLAALAALSGYAFAKWMAEPPSERKAGDLARFALGVGICAAVLMAYQWSSFGNPIFPAQTYMPAANYTELGYRGFSFPQFDLLMQTAFGMRYGLFTSAPILLTIFLFPLWLGRSQRLLERREIVLILSLTAFFFIFCAANQYGRMQFNTGVRHIVPVVPFIFLLAANVLLRLPRFAAALPGVIGTYWSWCLVMYRDVEQGLGVFESIKHITLEGFRLPWLTTLERMGFVGAQSAIPLLLLAGVVIWLMWTITPAKTNVEAA